MSSIYTIRVNPDWLDQAIRDAGSITALAEKLECSPSTVSRQQNEKAEAGPRFIGSVLSHLAVDFDQAFDVTEERPRVRSRVSRRRTTAA